MKKLRMNKGVLFTVVMYIISLVFSIFFSAKTEFLIEDLEIISQISNDNYIYLMIAGNNDTKIIKVNTKGEIIDENVMMVSSIFDKYVIEYEGSALTEKDGYIYAVRRWIDDTTMKVVKRDIIKLDANKLSKKPKVLYSYGGGDILLPKVTGLVCKDADLFISLVSDDNKKAYIDKLDLSKLGEENQITRVKSISSPVGDKFNNILSTKDGEMFALTKGGRVYMFDNKYGSKMLYPNSIVDEDYISMIELTDDDELMLYNQQTKQLNFYNQEKGIHELYYDSMNANKLEFFKYTLNSINQDVLDVCFKDSNNQIVMNTSGAPDDDTSELVVSFGDDKYKVIKSITYCHKIAMFEALKKSINIFLIFIGISVALLLIIYVIKNGKKIIYKFILIIIPILAGAFFILGYNESKNNRQVIRDLKLANAMAVNHATINNIDSLLVKELINSRNSYWNGAYSNLYDQIQVSIKQENDFEDISDEVLLNNKVAGIDKSYIYNEIFLVKDGKIYTGVSDKCGYMLPAGTEYFEGTEKLFDTVMKTNKPQIGNIASRIYRGGVYITPIKNKGEIIGFLSTTYDVYTITKFVSDSIKFYVKMAICLMVFISIPIYIMFQVVLKPLKELEKAVNELANGNYSIRLASTGKDEFSHIRSIFNKMCDQLNGSIYRVNNISQSYYRFVPRHLFSILGKKDILDVKLGDKRNMECILATHTLYNFNEVESKIISEGGDNLTDIIKFINRYFNIVYSELNNCNASLLSNDLKLNRIESVFLKNEKLAIKYAIGVIKKILADDKLNELVNLDMAIIIYKVNMVYGIVGEQERSFPFVLSLEKEQMDDILLDFRYSGAKIIITEDIKDKIEDWEDLSLRYIGYSYINNKKTRISMYEVLNCCDIKSRQQKESTISMFKNALDLFYRQEFYLARNEFSNIVKSSPLDNIARWYLFLSDKYCSRGIDNYNFELYGDKTIKLN